MTYKIFNKNDIRIYFDINYSKRIMATNKEITNRSEGYSQWYNDIVRTGADLIVNSLDDPAINI